MKNELHSNPNSESSRVVFCSEVNDLSSDQALQGLAGQLIEKSLQPEIKKYCPNDQARRFASLETFEDWWRQTPTTLIGFYGQEQDLAGIVFFRGRNPKNEFKETDCSSEVTFAIRIYDDYRGSGLSRIAMRDAHNWLFSNSVENPEDLQHFANQPNVQQSGLDVSGGVWLSVDKNNPRAQKLYQKFGYVVCGQNDQRILMEYNRN